MANTGMGPVDTGFVNSLRAEPGMGGGDSDIVTPVNYTSVNALRSRLNTLNSTYYNSAMLNSMTVNDMVFAVRNADDPKTIADYM